MNRILFLLAFAMTAALLQAEDFRMSLTFKNAQVAKLILGCDAKATDAPTDKVDIPVPPFGMESGIIGIRTSTPNMLLYQDIRSAKLPQKWVISCKVTRKPLTISWKRNELPKHVVLTLARKNGEAFDLHGRSRLVVSKTEDLTVTATAANSKKD